VLKTKAKLLDDDSVVEKFEVVPKNIRLNATNSFSKSFKSSHIGMNSTHSIKVAQMN